MHQTPCLRRNLARGSLQGTAASNAGDACVSDEVQKPLMDSINDSQSRGDGGLGRQRFRVIHGYLLCILTLIYGLIGLAVSLFFPLYIIQRQVLLVRATKLGTTSVIHGKTNALLASFLHECFHGHPFAECRRDKYGHRSPPLRLCSLPCRGA
jgi:hypothetical protein